jgi:hypothetical protein
MAERRLVGRCLYEQQKYGHFQPFSGQGPHLVPAYGINAGSVWRPAVVCAKLGNKRCRFAGTFTGATGLEPATSGVTGRRSNQLNYAPGARLV